MLFRSDMVLAETFFNSVARRDFTTIEVDNGVELGWFGATGVPRGEARAELFTPWSRTGDSAALIASILGSYEFGAPWIDMEGDARRVAARLDSFLLDAWDGLDLDGMDMIKPIFFRNKGAYLRSEERRVGKECRPRLSPYH